jgi:predicted trehalose synthase
VLLFALVAGAGERVRRVHAADARRVWYEWAVGGATAVQNVNGWASAVNIDVPE